MTEFLLRDVEDDDHDFLIELHNDPQVVFNLTNPNPVTRKSHLTWWNKVKEDSSEQRFIFTVDGQRAGFAKFYNIDKHNKTCVLGADLHSSFRGKKLSYKIWNLMLEHAFDHLDLNRVGLSTAEWNLIAQKVYEKLGFVEEGRLVDSLRRGKSFYDQILYYMTEDDYQRYERT
jgi:RimJ/RimL family protein N-acetyltransferase